MGPTLKGEPQMPRLSLKLPESLHEQLKEQAREEGISLNQYLVYLLARYGRPAYTVKATSEAEVEERKADYARFLESLGSATHREIREALDAREPGSPEPPLAPEDVEWMRERVVKATAA